MANWYYYNEDGEKVGPITSRQLKKLAAHGIVTPGTTVETENGTTGLAKDVNGLTFSESALKLEPELRPHNFVGFAPPDAGEIYGLAMPHPLPQEPSDGLDLIAKRAEQARLEAEASAMAADAAAKKEAAATIKTAATIKAAAEKRVADTKRAEQARLEAQTSAIAAEAAVEKEAAATMRAAAAIKAAAEKKAAEALKVADKMNAIAENAERKLRQHNASGTTGSNLFPGTAISILAMLLIGGIIGTVAWSMLSGTNFAQRKNNAQEQAANQIANTDNPFEDPTAILKPQRQTPSFTATEQAAIDAFVREFGDDVKAVDPKPSTPGDAYSVGETLLHKAVRFNKGIAVVKFLVSKGADVNVKNSGNIAPLREATIRENLEVVRFLISEGADVNTRGFTDNSTPLHIVARRNMLEFARVFVSNGANVNARDNRGNTPLDIARNQGHTAMVAYLDSVSAGKDNPFAD